MEELSDVRSKIAKFQSANRSQTLPAIWPISDPNKNVSSPPSFANLRPKSTFSEVIWPLENQPKPTPPALPKKPIINKTVKSEGSTVNTWRHSLDSHPVALQNFNRKPPDTSLRQQATSPLKFGKDKPPPLPKKINLSLADNEMRLGKGLRKTLFITDPSRAEGDRKPMENPSEKYRKSCISFSEVSAPPVPPDSPDCYEELIDDLQTKPKVPHPSIAHLKSPVSFSVPLPNTKSEDRNCYDVIDDLNQTQPKSPHSVAAQIKPPFSNVLENNWFEGENCYEPIDDILQTQAKSQLPHPMFQIPPQVAEGTTKHQAQSPAPYMDQLKSRLSSLIEQAPEINRSESQNCYEEVEQTLRSPTKYPPSVMVHTNAPLYTDVHCPLVPKMSQFNIQDTYEVVVSSDSEPPQFSEMIEKDRAEHHDVADSFFMQMEFPPPPPPFDDPPEPQIMSPLRNTECSCLPDFSHIEKTRKPAAGQKTKPKRKFLMKEEKVKEKPLPPTDSLGLPPPKPFRPPYVDLTRYLPAPPNANALQKTPQEFSATVYEEPFSRSAPPNEQCYDDALDLRSDHSEHVYEVKDNESGLPDVNEYMQSIQRPCPEQRETYYEDIHKLRDSGDGGAVYEVEDNDPSALLRRESLTQVDEGARNYGAGTLKHLKLTKNLQAFQKKFKVNGLETPLYTTTIVLDYKHEKNMLPLKRGDVVDVIRTTDCPPGKWLARDKQGNYGLVPVSSVELSKDLLKFSNRLLTSNDLYAEIDVRNSDSGIGTDQSMTSDSHSSKSDDTYDDTENLSSPMSNSGGKVKTFANLFRKDKNKKDNSDVGLETWSENGSISSSESNTIEKDEKSLTWRLFSRSKEEKGKAETAKSDGKINALMNKKFAKEEKIFREKFQYTGDINVLSVAMITDLAPLNTKGKLELPVKPGETVVIIDVTNEDKIVCRNSEGKYGYVRIEYLNFLSGCSS